MKLDLNSRPVKIGLLIVGIFLLVRMFSSCSQSKDALQVVRSVKVAKGDLDIKVSATGTVKPYNRVEIKPPIAGRVEEVLVKEGDTVRQGQVLAWMSSIERAALLDAARSQGDEIFKRWQEAYKLAPLLSPLEGTVIVRSVEPGQTVTTADPVVVISDRLIVEALVDETDLSFIQLGQKTEIHLDAYASEIFWGKVDHITYESQLVNNVNVYAVDVLPEQIPPSFRSGMTANVVFIVKERNDVLLVPSEAVMAWPRDIPKPQEAEFALYRKTFGGKLVPIPASIGDTDGRMTEITQGVKDREEIQIVRKKQESPSTNPFSPWGRGAKKPEKKEVS